MKKQLRDPGGQQGGAGPARVQALMAEFDSAGALLTAAEKVRDAGYTRWDTHSPFPVHGIDEAMGIRRTRLPWVVFWFGVVGCATGLLLQWWTNATNAREFPGVPTFGQGYDVVVSGKPIFSLPANIPVIFEMTVLLSALATVVGMLAMNNLPLHHSPLFGRSRFGRVTSDRFFVCIDADDPRFHPERTRALLAGLNGLGVEEVTETASPSRWPRPVVIGGMIVVCLALFPPLLAAKARLSKSPHPRIHIVQDMDNQERYKAQQSHALFADGREMRPQVAGTIARGDWPADTALQTGRVGEQWLQGLPASLELTEEFVRRGQQRYNIYCAPCHGLGGAGDGIVSARAVLRDTPNWVQPTSVVDQLVRDREDGNIFNTITNGIRSMPPYGDQISPVDRWAIVSYVRALQRSQDARAEDVPQDVREELFR